MVHKQTCIEEDNNGARRSSLPILATLLCTFTKAFNSFDSSNVWRKFNSCSPDRLSASLSDVIKRESAEII